MQKVNGDEIGTYDGVIRIIYGDIGKTIYLSAMGVENDRFISLNDCLQEIGYGGIGVVVVIIDDYMQGKVYMYGNYGNDWYEYGETRGFA